MRSSLNKPAPPVVRLEVVAVTLSFGLMLVSLAVWCHEGPPTMGALKLSSWCADLYPSCCFLASCKLLFSRYLQALASCHDQALVSYLGVRPLLQPAMSCARRRCSRSLSGWCCPKTSPLTTPTTTSPPPGRSARRCARCSTSHRPSRQVGAGLWDWVRVRDQMFKVEEVVSFPARVARQGQACSGPREGSAVGSVMTVFLYNI